MKPRPHSHTEARPLCTLGIERRRMLLAAATVSAVALAGACLPLLLAIPLAVLTTLIATAIGIGSRLIAIDHG